MAKKAKVMEQVQLLLSRSFTYSELCQKICGKTHRVLWLQILSKELKTLKKQS